MTAKPTVVTSDKLAAAKANADAERQRLRDEAYAEGVKIGERHKAYAFGLAGVIIGALLMGGYTMLTVERGVFSAGAVADRIVSRTVSPGLPAAPVAEDVGLTYERNAEAAREDACRRGVRDPRTGRCPGEPGQ